MSSSLDIDPARHSSTGAWGGGTASPTVLQVLPALEAGGVERGTVQIAGGIVRAGGRARVASSGGPMVHEVERAGGEHVVLPLAAKNPARIWANAKRLVALVESEKVDLVHARSRAPAWSAWSQSACSCGPCWIACLPRKRAGSLWTCSPSAVGWRISCSPARGI